jgi:outer membrane receptor protein involved in Fe transport
MEHGSFTADGSTVNLVGSYNDETSLPPLPKWKTNAAVGWKSTADAATLSLNYTSQLTEGVSGLNSEVASFATIDLSASHQFDNRFAVYFGVTNLANKEPPAQGNSILTANGLAYDLRGRVLQLGARQSF